MTYFCIHTYIYINTYYHIHACVYIEGDLEMGGGLDLEMGGGLDLEMGGGYAGASTKEGDYGGKGKFPSYVCT
jgi:hypothetical protein